MSDQVSLRERILKGGSFLAARQVVSMAISLGGVILLTRLIGPASYGHYTGAGAIMLLVARMAPLGVDTFLIRRKDEPDECVYHQAFTLLVLIALGVIALGYLGTFVLTSWLGDPRFSVALRVMLPTLLVTVVSIPAKAQIERAMNYRALAIWQMAEHVAFYVVALPLAVLGWGLWAALAGFWAMQVLVTVRCYTLTHYLPRIYWSSAIAREMLGYGVSYSASSWTWQLRGLANPLIVGRYLGAEAVAFVSLAIRFVEMLAFVKGLSWGISMVALSKVQEDLQRLRRGVEEAMFLQVLALGPVLGGFALVGPYLLPSVFGPEWNDVLQVYPFIALSYLINAVFNMQSSALYVFQRNRAVGLANAIHVVLFLGTGLVLVPYLGITGYGAAEIVAMSGYLVLHRRLREIVTVSYGRVWPWVIAWVPPLFAAFLPLPLAIATWIPAVAVFLWPEQRRSVTQYLAHLRWRTA